MPLIREDDVVRIDLPAEGEWVEVKARLSRGDSIAIQQALYAGQRSTGGRVPDVDFVQALDVAEFATLERAIRAWSFEEPVSPANIRALDEASVDAIKARLNELYGEHRTDDERKNSSGDGQTPSSAEGPSRPGSVG